MTIDGKTKRAAKLVAFVAGGAALLSTNLALAADVTVGMDETRSIKLDRAISTLSVGNPSIVGVTVQDGSTVFVVGRTFGRTNIFALDEKGQTISEITVVVTSGDKTVTLFRGPDQFTYNCGTTCERALMPGDAKEPFETLGNQINTKTAISEAAAKQ